MTEYDGKIVIIELGSKEFPFLESMYDENDKGNTVGLKEVFVDRLEGMLEDYPKKSLDALGVEKELEKLKLLDTDYIIIED